MPLRQRSAHIILFDTRISRAHFNFQAGCGSAQLGLEGAVGGGKRGSGCQLAAVSSLASGSTCLFHVCELGRVCQLGICTAHNALSELQDTLTLPHSPGLQTQGLGAAGIRELAKVHSWDTAEAHEGAVSSVPW